MRKITITSKLLHFLQPAGTSRGVYNTRLSFYLKLTSDEQPNVVGVGECATLPDLSCDAMPPNEYERKLRTFCDEYERTGVIDYEAMRAYPSMLFGLETAVAQFNAKGSLNFFNTPFGRGEEGIPINGLVWMGTFEEMFECLEAKLKAGFRCIKIKIGAIDFDRELQLIRHIRSTFSRNDVELRVDANGGFTPEEALSRMEALVQYDIHSIEQPIKQHQWTEWHAFALRHLYQ